MKKVLSLVLVLAMVLGTFSFAFAAPLNDVVGTDYEDAVTRLASLEVLNGYPDGTFKPDNTITRAEFAKAIVKVLGLESAANAAKGATVFTDVPATHWATGYINIASKMEYVKGMGNGEFAPEAPITYEQAVTLVMRALGYEEAAMARGGYPYGHLVVAAEEGVTDGVKGVQGLPASRGTVAQLLDNALEVPMMIQVGYGSDTKWVKSGTEDTDKVYLLDKLGFDKVSDRVVGIPRTEKSLEDDEILLANDEVVVVPADFDLEAAFGEEVTLWLDGDDVVLYDVDETAMFDALAYDADDEELTLVDADVDYDDIDEDVIVFLNGDEAKIKDVDGADYAKVILNDDKDVIFVDAYTWDDALYVDSVDKYEVEGYRVSDADLDKLDLEKYVVFKDGKTLAVSDIEEGDILFYNEDGKFAEVYGKKVDGEIEKAYSGTFVFDGDEYDYAGLYVDAAGDIDLVDDSVVDEMKDEGPDATIVLDREGNVVFVSGDLEEEEDTTTVYAYLLEDSKSDTHYGKTTWLLSVLTQAGDEVDYEVTNTFADEYRDAMTNNTSDGSTTEWKQDFTFDGGTPDDTSDDVSKVGTIVKLTLDEDGDLEDVAIAGETPSVGISSSNKLYTDENEIKGFDLSKDTLVFVGTNGDADDIKIYTWAEAEDEFDYIEEATVYVDSTGDVVAIRATKTSDDVETTTYVGVVTDIDKFSGIDKWEISLLADGNEVTYATEKDKFTKSFINSIANGDVIEIDVDDEAEEIVSGGITTSLSVVKSVSGKVEEVNNRNKTIKLVDNVKTYKFDGYVYDVEDADDIDVLELKDLEKGDEVALYYNSLTKDFDKPVIEFVLLNTDYVAPENPTDVSIKTVTSDGTVTVTGAVYEAGGIDWVVEAVDANGLVQGSFSEKVSSNVTEYTFSSKLEVTESGRYTIKLYKLSDLDTPIVSKKAYLAKGN